MNKAYKFRIYPTPEREKYFTKTFGCVRFVHNRMLSDRLENKIYMTPAKYKEEFEWLKEVDSLALCNLSDRYYVGTYACGDCVRRNTCCCAAVVEAGSSDLCRSEYIHKSAEIEFVKLFVKRLRVF